MTRLLISLSLYFVFIVAVTGSDAVAQTSVRKTILGSSLSLYDSTGRLVGPIVDIGCKTIRVGVGATSPFDSTAALLSLNDRLYPICATRSSFHSNLMVYFPSSDCTGSGYQEAGSMEWPNSSESLFVPSGIANMQGRKILYRPDYETGLQRINVYSYLHAEEGTCRTGAGGYEIVAYQLIQMLDLSSVYMPPFSVR